MGEYNEAGVQGICTAEHDVYLVDYRLGQKDGLELLRERPGADARADYLSHRPGGYDVDMEAMKAGAADYLVKSQITPDLLERSIRYAIASKTNRPRIEKIP